MMIFANALLVFVLGYIIAFAMPKAFVRKVLKGAMTSEQALKMTKLARFCGTFLMGLAVVYLAFCLIIIRPK